MELNVNVEYYRISERIINHDSVILNAFAVSDNCQLASLLSTRRTVAAQQSSKSSSLSVAVGSNASLLVMQAPADPAAPADS
jgi:hypothetical protein